MGQPQRIFDSLAYLNELKSVGFSEKQATVQAERLFDILDNQLLTRQDMHDMEMRLSNDIKRVDFNVKDVELRLSQSIQQVDSKISDVELRLSKEIQQVDSKVTTLESKITALESKIDVVKHDLLTRLGGLMVVLVTLLGVFIKMPIGIIH